MTLPVPMTLREAVLRGMPDAGSLVLLDLDDRSDVDRHAVADLVESDCTVIGFASSHISPDLSALLDVGYVPTTTGVEPDHCVAVDDPMRTAMSSASIATEHAVAVSALRRVLRVGAGMSVRSALEVESFAYSMLLTGRDFARWLTARGPAELPVDVADPVLVESGSGTMTITLNRAQRRNAYGKQLRDAFSEALDIAIADRSVTRVVIEGNGPSFCAGGDLAEFGTAADLAAAHAIRTVGGAAWRVDALRDRVEARLHGACVGAGLEIPAFAGRVVVAPSTTMRLPEIDMGLIPGAGGTVSVRRRAGRWKAFHLAVTGAAIDAPTALRWGLADAIESAESGSEPSYFERP